MSLGERYDYWLQGHEFRTIVQGYKNSRKIPSPSVNARIRREPKSNSYDDLSLPSLRSEAPRSRSCPFAAFEEDLFDQVDQQCYAGIFDEETFDEVYYDIGVC